MRQRWWVLGSVLVAVICFFFIRYIVTYLWPNPDEVLAAPQLLLIGFIFVGLSAGTVPFSLYLNNRFAKSGWLERDKFRLLREGAWVGVLGVLVASNCSKPSIGPLQRCWPVCSFSLKHFF